MFKISWSDWVYRLPKVIRFFRQKEEFSLTSVEQIVLTEVLKELKSGKTVFNAVMRSDSKPADVEENSVHWACQGLATKLLKQTDWE